MPTTTAPPTERRESNHAGWSAVALWAVTFLGARGQFSIMVRATVGIGQIPCNNMSISDIVSAGVRTSPPVSS